MARVAVVCPDLLFGSKLEGGLGAAGQDVERVDDEPGAWAAVRADAEALVVDLGVEEIDGAVLVDSMRSDGELRGVATVGFYPHVEAETRRRAEEAGFDVVVPRSRMAREMGPVLERALAAAAGASPAEERAAEDVRAAPVRTSPAPGRTALVTGASSGSARRPPGASTATAGACCSWRGVRSGWRRSRASSATPAGSRSTSWRRARPRG